jgi:hypothetical protein
LDHYILEEARCASQEETRARKHVVFPKGLNLRSTTCGVDLRRLSLLSALQTD